MVQGGVVAAFGLVRGSAQADMLQLSVGNPFTPQLLAQVRHKALGIKQLMFCSPVMACCAFKVHDLHFCLCWLLAMLCKSSMGVVPN